jgi:hypothetical protein
VVVAVKVPRHLELVSAALTAVNSVYCEWPLGNGLEEAIRMADLDQDGRGPAGALLARDQVRGRSDRREVLYTTLIGNGLTWGGSVPSEGVYTLDRRNGATLLTVPFGHAVDA